jgi:hypothetical protein
MRFRIEPTFGRDEEPGKAKPDDRAQDKPGKWSSQERHGCSRCDDQARKGCIGADVADPFDDAPGADGADRQPGIDTAKHEARHGRVEAFVRHAQ